MICNMILNNIGYSIIGYEFEILSIILLPLPYEHKDIAITRIAMDMCYRLIHGLEICASERGDILLAFIANILKHILKSIGNQYT